MADQQVPDSRAYMQLPPADFSFLVESLLMQAQVQLGLLHFGDEHETPKPNLVWAKHSIDLLQVLQEKTSGNLGDQEQRLLENGLTELRFRYVQVADEESKQKSGQAESPLIIAPDGGKGSKTS